ncbi:transmembrane protein 60-like [Rattus rattus]|uniref:transmembrane protein 60-like n=1 Tax=Rattus rattus TaxID=10117 RepID=UPI0013F2C81A|nr:transmembrane protein 60-like [Rattus rattus]
MRMSLAQRVLLAWLFTLLFFIVLVLKLDEKAPWNWFLVFIPVWIFDTILLVMLIVKMAGLCKSGFDPRHGSHNIKKKKPWYLITMLLKLAFCLTLCAKLEQFTTINLSYVFIPLWALLVGALTELGYNVFFCERLTSEYINSFMLLFNKLYSILNLYNFQE